VVYLTFRPFQKFDFLVCGFSTRLGGVSTGIYSSMNLSYQRGDLGEAVDENYMRMCRALGVKPEQLVYSNQVHGTRVAYIDGSRTLYLETDGLITDQSDCILTTSYADCVPLYFVDPVKKAVGLSHSGWRGTVGKIGAETVKQMREQFGCKSNDLIAVVGPSICKDCYEVSEDVAKAFMAHFQKEQVQNFLRQTDASHYQLDLWKANEFVLKDSGLLPENIHISGLCTCCNSKLLFSHRATQGKRGNMNGFLGIH
ncbi:MAG: purine-nucleoside/S-methyl-5-thioadenosine phosphorylase / adenosine deaminase, partial [Clostridiales bacterium]|nr:purine-nucleoside/S-methyl-5-thioadenosine phosphorylase / adenosine deaminase [Clostridiales bacterium]